MDHRAPAMEMQRKLDSGDQAISGGLNRTQRDVNQTGDVGTSRDSAERFEPPKKKPKLAPMRPLRVLRPVAPYTSSNPGPSGKSNASIVESFDKSTLRTPRSHSATAASEDAPTALDAPSGRHSQTTTYCAYCKRSIDGGEPGLRRHQTGEMHVQNVLRGIVKYVAPLVLPATMWKYPPQIHFNIQERDFLTFFNEQMALCEKLFASSESVPQSSSSSPTTSSSSRPQKLDCDFLMFLAVMEPQKIGANLEHINLAYTSRCRQQNRFILDKAKWLCPFCDVEDEYSVSKPKSAASTSASTSGPPPVPSSISPLESSTVPPEECLVQFWKHLASEGHRNMAQKFWREHHVCHPSLHHNKPTPTLPTTTVVYSKKTSENRKHNQDIVMNSPPGWFDSSSYLLTQSQLQRLLESWSNLKRLVEALPKKSRIVDVIEEVPVVPVAPTPKTPHAMNPNLPIKEQILKHMKPGDPKPGDRVGAKWADAVKAFLSVHSGMTTRQLIQLVRLERVAHPHRKKKWYPNFGGVWNESTRSDHARNFFASQR